MEDMEVFLTWLDQLAKELQLENLSLDEKNRCYLMFDDTMLVEIELKPEDNTFILKGNLGDISEAKIKQIYPRLLEANLLWKETNGATLGLQQYSKNVLLVQTVPVASCDYALFNKSLEFFVNTFEYWIKFLKELQSKSGGKKNEIFSDARV